MKLAVILLLVFTLYDKCNEHRPTPVPVPSPAVSPTPSPTATPVPSPTPTPAPLPCSLDGDITDEITAAVVKGVPHTGGGCIRSQLVIEGALQLGEGTYQFQYPLLLRSNSTLSGASWLTVVVGNQFTVIAAHDSYFTNGAVSTGITVRNLKVTDSMDETELFDSVHQAISLGNCQGCMVDNVWVADTQSIGIQLGGGSFAPSQYALTSRITNCLLTGVASQGIACVNCQHVEISGNKLLNGGQVGGPSFASIDLEVNTPTDRLKDILVINNIVDQTSSPVTGNGIIANSGESELVGNILIAGNTVRGGPRTANGIMVFGQHMQKTAIAKNTVTRAGQTGMWLVGSLLLAEDNIFENIGGGGIEGLRLSVSNSEIRRNSYKCTLGPCDNRMVVTGTNNIIEDNTGWGISQLKRRKKR